MRTLVSLLSCCTLLIAQTPLIPCPAAATDRARVATATTAAAAPQSAHEPAAAGARTAAHVHAAHATNKQQHEQGARHHTNVVAAAGAPAAAALSVPSPQEHDGTCTMLTRCDWVAVPTEPIGSANLPRFGSAVAAAPGAVPAVGDLSSSTPPPRPIS